MKMSRGARAVLGVAVWTVEVWATEIPRIPVEDFARSPDLSAARLSPDGEFMGYIFTHEGRDEMSFLDLKTGKARYFNAGRSVLGTNLQVTDFLWISDKRVVVQTTAWGTWFAGLAAVDRTASGWLGLSGAPRWESIKTSAAPLYARQIIYTSGRDPRRLLLLDQNAADGEKALYPDVIEMDAETGAYQRVLRNPGEVLHWLADWNGDVRFGLQWDGQRPRLIYRLSPAAAWQQVNWGEPGANTNFVGLDPTGAVLHVSKAAPGGRWGLFSFDIKSKLFSEPLFKHEHYDIMPPEYNPSYAGMPLAAAVYSPKSRQLLGLRYVTEGPHQYWFDPAMSELQRQIDALLPNLTNMIVSMDYAENRLLVLSWSDREPGIYSLVDLAGHQTRIIGRRMPWIKPEQMAQMFPIECKARDGLALHGYLTLPLGGGAKNLPLVMLVQGGPWVRDVWGFDPLVQFLANRGYAVLQINYRGSVGYGSDFVDKGKAEVGGAIQDDITDAVHWAIQKGIADARRVAIMGGSYGGYSTLFALAKNPELYRCGIDIAGVTDWDALMKNRDKGEYKIAYAHWVARVGDMKDEKILRRLEAASPVNFAGQITAPLLIVHGDKDNTVPIEQAKAMVSALRKAGRKPETLYFSNLGHRFPHEKDGVEFLSKIAAFLAANLGE